MNQFGTDLGGILTHVGVDEVALERILHTPEKPCDDRQQNKCRSQIEE
jgi:hypothetical protein